MHYRSLDGLRGLAACTVVIAHFENQTKFLGGILNGAGQLGVMLFFVLSGFLMGRLYLHQTVSTSSVLRFFRKRAARVFPLYFAVVLASYAWTQLSGQVRPAFSITDKNIWEHVLFWRGTSVLWTIPVEVQFYALFPILWFIFAKRKNEIVIWLALLMAVVAALGFPQTPVLLHRLPFFLLGVGVSLLPAPRASTSIDFLFAVSLIGFFLMFPGIRELIGMPRGGLWGSSVYMAFMPALLLAALWSPLADRVLGSAPGKFLGDISYSIYLLHMPVLYWLRDTAVSENILLFTACFLGATILLSWASFRFFETPLRRYLSGGKEPAGRLKPSPAV